MWLLSEMTIGSSQIHGLQGEILPKNSPVRAVKPAARQPEERGQIVG